MLKPELSNQFKRDYNLLIRRGYDITRLDAVVLILLKQTPLEPRHRDHPLNILKLRQGQIRTLITIASLG